MELMDQDDRSMLIAGVLYGAVCEERLERLEAVDRPLREQMEIVLKHSDAVLAQMDRYASNG